MHRVEAGLGLGEVGGVGEGLGVDVCAGGLYVVIITAVLFLNQKPQVPQPGHILLLLVIKLLATSIHNQLPEPPDFLTTLLNLVLQLVIVLKNVVPDIDQDPFPVQNLLHDSSVVL